MPYENYKNTNNAQWELLVWISASATSIILKTGQGGLFPSTFPFLLKLEQFESWVVTKREIVKATGRAGDTITIVRSQGYCTSTDTDLTQTNTAFAFNPIAWPCTVTQTVTAEQIKDIQDELNNAVKKTGDETIAWRKHFVNWDTFLGESSKSYADVWNLGTSQDVYFDTRSDVYSAVNTKFRTKWLGTFEWILNSISRMVLSAWWNLLLGTWSIDPNVRLEVKSMWASSSVQRWISSDGQILVNIYEESDTRVSFLLNNASNVQTIRLDTNGSSYLNGGSLWLGTSSPVERLDVVGGMRIGTAVGTNAWTIQWTGTEFQGRTASAWIPLGNAFVWCKAFTSSFASTLTLTTVPLGSESFDTNAFHDNVTNNSRLTIPTWLGWNYLIIANGKVNGATVYTQTGVELWKNGALFTVGNANYNQWRAWLSFTEVDNCSAWDYFELKIQTDPNRTWDYISLSLIKQ